MQTKHKVATDLNRLNPIETTLLAGVVAKGLKANDVLFKTPTPTVDELTQQSTTTVAAIEDAKSRDKVKMAQRNLEVTKLKNMLRTCAMYVDMVAQGDYDTIIKSGFTPSKVPTKAQDLVAPTDFKLRHSVLSGGLEASCKRPVGAKFFKYQVCTTNPAVEANWTDAGMSFSSRHAIAGLTPGQQYWFRVCAVNAVSVSDWSDVANTIAL